MKVLLTSLAMMLSVVLLSSATNPTEPTAIVLTSESSQQCGVTNAQITTYLQECSHHHTVYWVQDISGTCNSLAGIENNKAATVIVQSGIIVGHSDANYNPPQ